MRLASLTASTFASLVLVAACAPAEPTPPNPPTPEENVDLASGDKADRTAAADVDAFYLLERDTRECAAPACGGWFIERISRAKTVCADGTSADRCYVRDLDVSRVGLADDERDGLIAAPDRVIVRGNLGRVAAGGLGVLTVTEAYVSTDGGAPETTVYELTDNGTRCFTFPCFSLDARKLNSEVLVTLSGLDGELGQRAAEELEFAPVLVTGPWRTVTAAGPAGDGRVLAPTRVWTRVQTANPAACLVDSDCEVTAYSRFVASPADCYCPTCEDGVLSRAAAEENRASWERHCAAVRLACSGEVCVAAPAARCEAQRCTVAAPVGTPE